MGRARDKALPIKWARRILQSDNWVVLDTSSTGFSNAAVVTQVAIVNPAGETLLDTLVKPPPRKRITEKDLESIGVDKETLKAAPTFSEVKSQIESVAGDKTVLSYNRDFRERVFKQTADRLGETPPDISWGECVMERYSRLVGDWLKGGEGEYKWQKLPRNGHPKGAVGDCLAVLDLIQKMADEPMPEAPTRTRKESDVKEKSGCLSVVAGFALLVLIGLALI